MTRSDTIGELAAAMAKAQAAITGAIKSSKNPHFGNRYADLASVWEGCRGPLTDHGLSVIQFPRLTHLGGEMWAIELDTLLLHASGEWLADTLAIPVLKIDAQSIGSAITYARRYALGAVAGVAPEDDDGEGAVGRASESGPRVIGEPPLAAMARVARMGSAAPKDAAPMATVRGKVLGHITRAAGTGTRHVITLDDQRTYGTLVQALSDVATDAAAAGAEVEITYRDTRLGREIATIRDLSEPDPPI